MAKAEKLISEVRRQWDADGGLIIEAEIDCYLQQTGAWFAKALGQAYVVGWDIMLRRVALADLSRTKGMLNGPLFTSAKYPWPIDDEQLMIPIIQLNLAEISRLARKALGAGLLQVWQGAGGMVTRVISPGDVVLASNIPTLVPGRNLDAYHFDVGHFGLPSFLTNVHQIVGFDGPYIFGPPSLDEQLRRYIASPAATKPLSRALMRLWREVSKGRESREQVNRLFGSFDGVAVYPEDRPPSLFSSDDDRIFNTGDAGVITVYYDISLEKVSFGAEFQSC